MYMTRRELALALGALAAAPLAGCGLLGREEVPDLAVGGADDALSYALGALRGRYGEGFAEVEGVERRTQDLKHGKEVAYWLTLAPTEDAGKQFSCSVRAEAEGGRLLSVAQDDYTQYVFKEQMEGPYREAVAGVGSLAGCGVVMREPYMGDRLWRADELEAYLANGYTHPGVEVTLMLPRDGDFDSWAATIHAALAAVWGLGRRLSVYAGFEGTDPLSTGTSPFALDISQWSPKTRDTEPPDEAAVMHRMKWVLGDDDTSPWDGYEPWDGTGDPGDPGRTTRAQITWNPGHPVMG